MTAFNNDIIYKPELLAPAGGKESFFGVLRAGADAVYLAGEHYGARAYAENFTDEELDECIRYAHLYGKKVYITINTLIKNSETEDLVRFVKPFYEAGLDGVIVQDIGIISLIKENFPYLEIHASTQMSITTTYGAEFLKGMGVSRIVPARELSLDEIRKMKKETGLELECFIHGAMCYCYSGQCLFSSVLGGRSGNRGKCAQPCRLPYTAAGKEEYPLSMKDMCTINMLGDLIDAGIDSFKIEGRMKKAEYAAGVTAIYRKYIDRYYVNKSYEVDPEDLKTLESLYIRSAISDGYYNRYNGKDMISISSPAYKGADEKVLGRIREEYLTDSPSKGLKPFKVKFEASFICGEKAFICVKCGDFKASACGDTVETAKSAPITAEDVKKSLKKLGGTVFAADERSFDNINVSGSAYYSLKGINELRRKVLFDLEHQIAAVKKDIPENVSDYLEKSRIKPVNNSDKGEGWSEGFHVLANSTSQLKELKNFSKYISRVYIPEELFIKDKGVTSSFDGFSRETEIFCALAFIRRYKDISYIGALEVLAENDKIQGFLVRNLEDLKLILELKERHPKIKIQADYSLYIWNHTAASHIGKYADSLALPLELSSREQKYEAEKAPGLLFEKMVYGRYPLMQSANCVLKTAYECRKKSGKTGTGFVYLKDRTGRNIPVYADCTHCHNTIYNAVVFSAYDFLKTGYPENTAFRIDFTDEDDALIKKVMSYYTGLLLGKESNKPSWEYTTGFEKKSAE